MKLILTIQAGACRRTAFHVPETIFSFVAADRDDTGGDNTDERKFVHCVFRLQKRRLFSGTRPDTRRSDGSRHNRRIGGP